MKRLTLFILLFVLLFVSGMILVSNTKQTALKTTNGEIKMANGQIQIYNPISGGANVTDPNLFSAVGAIPEAQYIPDISGNYTGAPTSYSGATSTGGAAAAPVDPYAKYGGLTAYNNTVGGYDQAINNTQSGIDRLPNQLNSALTGVSSSAQNALNQLLLGKNQGQAAYTTNKNQTSANYVQGKNTVGFNAGNSLNSLLRLLGSRGAGGGSPIGAARGAVAGEATQQRTGLGNTFAQNNQSLDTNWNNFLTGYNNEVTGVGNQRDQQEQQLRSTDATNKASLLQSLATLAAQKAAYTGGDSSAASQPFIDQANALLNSNSNYTVAPINYKTSAYTAPDLAKYTTNPNSTPTVQGQVAGNDYISPYLAALLGKKQLAAA